MASTLVQSPEESPKTKPEALPCRLHIGAMGPHSLVHPALEKLIDRTWIHLGDEPDVERRTAWMRLKNGLIRNLRPFVYRLKGRPIPDYAAIRHRTRFVPFYYEAGDRLEFADAQFGFIFSEHFFEHLYLDEAAALFEECRRMLKPGGVLRVVVPDADLRICEKPEPPGYPGPREGWHEPDKHKTRWSVYSLTWVLGQCDFAIHPVVCCDKFGNFHLDEPRPHMPVYRNSLDEPFVFDLGYIKRLGNSLVVDAIKPGPGVERNAAGVCRNLHRNAT